MKGTYFKKHKVSHIGNQYAFYLFGICLWASFHYDKGGWIRIFNRGLSWKHKSLGLIFSERNGYTKYYRIGKWTVRILQSY